MEIDYLIIGQGLAGSILSYELIKRGRRVVVMNDSNVHSSSRAAAGIFNPITGRKMVKTWMAHELFPYLRTFYKDLETTLKTKFYHPTSIYRPYISIEEQNEWMGKSAMEDYAPFIHHNYLQPVYKEFVNDDYGGLELKQGGYVDTKKLLDSYRNLLISKNGYKEEYFDEAKLEFEADGLKYDGISARKVIFCDGPSGKDSKFFSWLPYRTVKGETLIIEPEKDFSVIFNRGVFILPTIQGTYRVGATYDWKDTSLEVTESAKKQLVEKLDLLLKTKYKIIDQVAGHRPATKDRRPFVGQHPEMGTLCIFNGFGTKGVSLIPYFAKEFCDFLECNKNLNNEVNITRYFSLY
ncbi:FAD-dependent oxidoreductase [Fulvivirgaceae bacterium BMA10]|uniref:FAD-dependent oxidoreductase n=1 Tax=Splendidivirga corallicola TaxID=3051826 RepID=A0ABT8KMT2_9BACT|nr:FAD-dependent oxidoreductase [Fulvivirgaceae bacterium BMA10]